MSTNPQDDAKSTIDRLETDNAQLREKVDQLKNDLNTAVEDTAFTRRALHQAQEENAKLFGTNRLLQREIGTRKQEYDGMQSTIDRLETDNAQLREKVDQLKTEQQNDIDGNHALQEERDAMAEDVQSLKNALATQQAIGDAMASELTNLRAKLQDADRRVTWSRAIARRISKHLRDMRGELAGLDDLVDSTFALGGHTWRGADGIDDDVDAD